LFSPFLLKGSNSTTPPVITLNRGVRKCTYYQLLRHITSYKDTSNIGQVV